MAARRFVAAHESYDTFIIMTDLKNQVLALPKDEKRELFEALRSDLSDFDEKILPILEQRSKDLKSGKVKAIPAEEAFAAIRADYHRKFG